MNYKNYLIVILCIPVLSCTKPIPGSSMRFELMSEIIVKNTEISFRFHLDDDDRTRLKYQPLFAELSYSCSNDTGRWFYNTIRLSDALEGNTIVPDNAATVRIYLSTKEHYVEGYSSETMMVLEADLQPVRKAWLHYLWSQYQKGICAEQPVEVHAQDSMFTRILLRYPDDLSIYACKWMYTMRAGLLDSDEIQKDMKIVSEHHGHAYTDALLYMGRLLKTLARNHSQSAQDGGDQGGSRYLGSERIRASKGYPLPDSLISKPNNPIFNEPFFINWLFAMRGPGYLVSTEWLKEIEKIMQANPQSLYSDLLLLSGIYKSITPKTALSVVEEKLRHDHLPLYMYYKMKILAAYYPDRRDECLLLVEELKKVIKKNKYYEEGLDPTHKFQQYRIEPYVVEGDLLASSGLYDSAIAVVGKAQELLNDPWDIRNAMIFSQISDYYLKKGSVDTSTKYMVAAASIAPGQKFISDILRERYNRANTKWSYEEWYQSIKTTLPIEAHPLIPGTLLKLLLSNDSVLDFDSLGDTMVIIECWEPSCSFCSQNLKLAIQFSATKRNSDVHILVASKSKMELDAHLKRIGARLPVVKDGDEFLRAFNITSFPVTLVIKNSRVVGRYSGLFEPSKVFTTYGSGERAKLTN